MCQLLSERVQIDCVILIISCLGIQELSIFGQFRKLDEKIDSLIGASNVKELLHNCLDRLEKDYDDPAYSGNLVKDVSQTPPPPKKKKYYLKLMFN